MNPNKTFEDLVQAIQTMAYGEGKYMNDNTRDNMDSIAISLYRLQEQTERIANVLETLVELYEWNLPKKDPKSIYQKYPGIDMTSKVQTVLDKIRARQSQK